MSNRGLMGLSIVSGLIAILIFIMIISAYGGSRAPSGVAVQPTPGQPVDSEMIYGPPDAGNAPAQAAPTPQPVQQPQQAGQQGTTVEAPPASAPANPFTTGIH